MVVWEEVAVNDDAREQSSVDMLWATLRAARLTHGRKNKHRAERVGVGARWEQIHPTRLQHKVTDKRLRTSIFELYDADDSGLINFEVPNLTIALTVILTLSSNANLPLTLIEFEAQI